MEKTVLAALECEHDVANRALTLAGEVDNLIAERRVAGRA